MSSSILSIVGPDIPHEQALTNAVNQLIAGPGNGTQGVIAVPITVDGSGAAGITFKPPYSCIVIDITVECTVANAAGTLQLRNGVTAISDAIACATNNALGRAASLTLPALDQTITYNVLAGGTSASATRGIMYLFVIRN